MRYPPVRRRYFARQYARLLTRTSSAGTSTTLDLGQLLARLELRGLLQAAGVRPGGV